MHTLVRQFATGALHGSVGSRATRKGWGDTPGLLSIAGLHLVELRLLPLKCRDREIVCGGLEARGDLVVGGGELARFLRVRGRGMVKARPGLRRRAGTFMLLMPF